MEATKEEKMSDALMFALTEEEAAFFSMPICSETPKLPVEPSKVQKMRKTYLVPTHLAEAMDAFCTENDVKKTDVVALAFEEFLAKYK